MPFKSTVTLRVEEDECLRLYSRGRTYAQIAVVLNLRPTTVPRRIAGALARQTAQTPDESRLSADARFEAVASVYGELLDDSDPRIRLSAANGLQAVEGRRIALWGTRIPPPKLDLDGEDF